jgi:hypothetical protein
VKGGISGGDGGFFVVGGGIGRGIGRVFLFIGEIFDKADLPRLARDCG